MATWPKAGLYHNVQSASYLPPTLVGSNFAYVNVDMRGYVNVNACKPEGGKGQILINVNCE